MLVYSFDRTLDGLLTAVFDAYALRQQPDELVGEGEVLPMFTEEVHRVATDDVKAGRVWAGLEQRLTATGVRIVAVSWLSERPELAAPLFRYVCKVFQQPAGACSLEHNASDADVLFVRNTCRRVLHEALHMKQFLRFQKAKDGTYLGVMSPDHNVLPLVTDHFRDRFGDQSWLIYDARRRYGYYYDAQAPAADRHSTAQPLPGDAANLAGETAPGVVRVTFDDAQALPFDLDSGQLADELLSSNDKLFQELWRTYFKAICIRERMNPRKQQNDMPRRYWKYMTEKQ